VTLELVFPAAGSVLSTDHAYPLYAALSSLVTAFHAEDSPLRFAPLTGIAQPDGTLQLGPHSCLRVRLPDDQVRLALPLAGKRLDVAGAGVRLGVPAVRTLVSAPAVVSRIVTFKMTNGDTPTHFLSTARAKLAELGVTAEPSLPIHLDGERAGEPKRRVIRVKGVAIVGYSLLVSELSAADSLTLQERGLGGRTHLGCGFFVPAKTEGK
jgi:CRISPR-associated protein Cas6